MRADLQPAQDAGAILRLAQHQHRDVAGALQRAQLAAQAQPVEGSFRSRLTENAVEIALGGAQQRLLRIGSTSTDVEGRERDSCSRSITRSAGPR